MLVISPNKCVGCRLCELVCSYKNFDEFNPIKSMIHVIGFEEMFSLPITCFHCEEPYCQEICPANAITRDQKSGAVQIISTKCIGCKMCVLACPFGNIHFNSEKKIAQKCNLCDGNPECVNFCPTGALQMLEDYDIGRQKKEFLHETLKKFYVEQAKENMIHDINNNMKNDC